MTNKPKHTPGPWWESMDGEIQSDTYRICNPFLNSGMVPKIEEQEANAALIAAAPELLAALQSCVRLLHYTAHGDSWQVVQAEGLLSKIKGE